MVNIAVCVHTRNGATIEDIFSSYVYTYVGHIWHIAIGIVEKEQETSLDTAMSACVITVLHEQSMYLGIQTHTRITLCTLVTI